MKFTQEGFNFDVGEIKDADMLSGLIEKMFSEFTPDEYHLKETHEYLMCLPEKFYNNFILYIMSINFLLIQYYMTNIMNI